MFTESELEHLDAALGEYMSDAYGEDNAEGCFTPQQWAELQSLSEKINRMKPSGSASA